MPPRPDPFDVAVDPATPFTPPSGAGSLVFPQDQDINAAQHFVLIQVTDDGGAAVTAPPPGSAKTMALLMPSPVLFVDQHAYQTPSLSELGFAPLGASVVGAGLGALGSLGLSSSWLPQAGKSAGAGYGTALAAQGVFGDNVFKLGRRPILTAQEIIYSNTMQRAFDMEFILSPRSPAEAEIIKNIIKSIRFYAAPEGLQAEDYIVLWAAPGRFRFTFYSPSSVGGPARAGSNENVNVQKIGESVITRVETDYTTTTDGMWTTFSDGFPVSVRILLSVMELAPIDREKIGEGF